MKTYALIHTDTLSAAAAEGEFIEIKITENPALRRAVVACA